MTKACRLHTNKRQNLEIHPDKDKQIVGMKINNWGKMVSEVKDIHSNIMFVKFIGWDIAMIEDDFLIIEANHLSDVDLLQCHGTLLTEEKGKVFFNQYL